MTQPPLPALQPVEDGSRAELLLHPLRQRILSEAREPSTAAEIARRIGQPPQRVNYHVRALAEAAFLRPAGESRRRNLIEKRYRASAESYLLLPRLLGELSAVGAREADRFSAAHLMQVGASLQQDLAVWLEREAAGARRVPTMSLEADLRFDSAQQRAAFADALHSAMADVIRLHAAPSRDVEGRPLPGRPYRLVVGCYPVPDRREPDDTPTRSETD